ncbi:MAG: hypothetical protein GXP42_16165 [Chloroflexi bacterium]|nr:hypothetical protein [Chloroflexota bacterium]
MFGKILRIVAIILMGVASTLMLLGGVGTICVAWFPERWESLAVLAPYKIVYQISALATILAGLAGIGVMVKLIRRSEKGHFFAILVLLVSLATAATKMAFSFVLRGGTAPTHIRFYFTLFTLAFFLFLRMPGVRERVRIETEDEGRSDGDIAGGLAAIMGGALALSVSQWAGPTHTWNGINYAAYWRSEIMFAGWTAILFGALFLGRFFFRRNRCSSSLSKSGSQVCVAPREP